MIQENAKLPSMAENDKMWEQRRYEIAKTILPTIVEICTRDQPVLSVADRVSIAIDYADELINQLKSRKVK